MGRLSSIIAVFILVLAPLPSIAADGGPPIAADAGDSQPESPAAPELPADRAPTVTLKVEPQEVGVGEVVIWRVTVKHRVGDRVHLSSGASFGSLEVRTKDVTAGETQGDWMEEVLSVELIGFEPEEVSIPAQKLTVVDVEGRIKEIETETSKVTVKSHIANEPEPQLKEDQGPGEPVFEKDYTLIWILGILGGAGVVALLTLLGRWLWSKRRPRPEPPPPPPRPAEEIAREKLKALRESNLLELGQIKDFHVRLSEAIREYLGNRYRFDSLERSTEELIVELKNSTIGRVDFEYTSEFLGETDLVKFAKMIPTLEESRALLDKSFEFVEKTTPRPVVSEAESAKKAVSKKSEGSDA